MAAVARASSSSSALTGSQLAIMPLVTMAQIGTGALTGHFVTRKKKQSSSKEQKDEQHESNVRMCTIFANSGPLPLLFADALFSRTNSGIQYQVVACISFYLLAWSPLFWSFGKLILSMSDKTVIGQDNGLLARFSRGVKQFLSPPVIGSIGGLIIGATPALRQTFLQGFAYPLYSALHTLGTAYLPAALLVLAGSLASKKAKTTAAEEQQQPGMSARSIATIAFSPFVLAPCWALACWWGLGHLGLLGAANSQSRAILSFVILMEGCMPPAQNSVILLQLVGLTQAASSMAKTLTVLYGMAVLPVALLLSASLSISGISQFL
jgi:predicted permease